MSSGYVKLVKGVSGYVALVQIRSG